MTVTRPYCPCGWFAFAVDEEAGKFHCARCGTMLGPPILRDMHRGRAVCDCPAPVGLVVSPAGWDPGAA